MDTPARAGLYALGRGERLSPAVAGGWLGSPAGSRGVREATVSGVVTVTALFAGLAVVR